MLSGRPSSALAAKGARPKDRKMKPADVVDLSKQALSTSSTGS
jgi:hypothetical protein